ncbi:recombinase family protein [Shewanella sp. 0m-8]
MTTYIYARVSTNEQNVHQQVDYLQAKYPKTDFVVTEKASGKTLDRPEYKKLVAHLVEGDTLIVKSVDRLGRDALAVQQQADELCKRGVNVVVSDLDGTNLNSTAGRIILAVMAQIAQAERETLLERQRIGIDRAKAEGKYKGRTATPDATVARAKELRTKGLSMAETAKTIGVGVSTLYRLLK